MAKRNIQVTITEWSTPLDARIRKSREDLIDLIEDITYHGIGRMYDQFGNPVEPYLLVRAERMAIVGFEFTGGLHRGPRWEQKEGWRSFRRHAKMLGYITDEPPETDD